MIDTLFYESELKQRIQDAFKVMYKIENEEYTFNYLLLRFMTINKIKKIEIVIKDIRQLLLFILNELNIPHNNKYFIYKELTFNITGNYNASLQNIVEDIMFQSSLKGQVDSFGNYIEWKHYIDDVSSKIIHEATNKSKKYKKEDIYEYYFKYFLLKELNGLFKTTPMSSIKIDGIKYPDNFDFYKRTLEEICDIYISNYKYLTSKTNILTESMLENYLKFNLNKIEEGLQLIDTQVEIKNGIIDILAKDKNNQIVIIELKVEQDERLIWQSIYYPMQYKKEHSIKSVRMLTVAPEYKEHISEPLSEIKGVEMLKFTPKIEKGIITDLYVDKIR